MVAILSQEAYSVDEVKKLLGLSKTSIYKEIGDGRLQAVKCGRRTLILRQAVESFLKQLPSL